MKRLFRLATTISYLRPGQIVNRVTRKLMPPRIRPLVEFQFRPISGHWAAPAEKNESFEPPRRFTFLNQTVEPRFPDAWNDPSSEKLWLYNLHYFDWLGAPSFTGPGSGDRIAVKWVIENPIGTGNGWEPYPLSLRLVNWAKAYLRGTLSLSLTWESFCRQSDWLSQSVEWHILANHLFANAKALVFAGATIDGALGERLLNQGLGILDRELDEQILPDGGHFERSPMYHAIILEDVLDLLNLAQAYPAKFESALVGRLRNFATKMMRWLQVMCHPDGEIAFFNDCAFGIAARPSQLFDYGERLALSRPRPIAESVDLPESGYTRLQNGDLVVFVNTAPIEPAYQPGHAHADTLSVEVSVGGQRVIVNGGTSTYQNLERRAVERSTAQHNTIEIDGENSSDVWAGFRVARRAQITARTVDLSIHCNSISAEVAPSGVISTCPRHRRRVAVQENRIEVIDWIADTPNRWTSRLHFAPDIVLHQNESRVLSAKCKDGRQLSLNFSDPVQLEKGHWAPEFGLLLPNVSARISPTSRKATIEIETR